MAGTLTKGTANLWLDTANPGASEPYVTKGNFWENTSTANIFFCNDPTAGIQSWLKVGVLTSALTQYGVLVADANSNITNISVGATGTVLSGNTGANPSFTATPAVTSITLNGGTALGAYLEQQAWTPVITGGTVAGAGTYSSQVGYYTRIGNMIFATCHIVWSAHTGTGDMTITGLPFSARNSANYHPEGTINPSNIPLPGAATSCRGDIAAGTSVVSMYVLRSNNTNDPVQMNGTGTLHLTIAYLT